MLELRKKVKRSECLRIIIVKPIDEYNSAPLLKFEKLEENDKKEGWYYYPEKKQHFVKYLKEQGFDDEEIEYIVNIVEFVSEFA
ncbi:hypothetical protein [Archaeoglobus sp.]